MKKITPVLVVETIEPVLPFWVDRLGFEKTTELPHGDRLGFVILARNGVEIMYQSMESVLADVPQLAEKAPAPAYLFIEVEDLEEVVKGLEGVSPVVPRRQTFYGSDVLIVRDPVGNVITFAKFA